MQVGDVFDGKFRLEASIGEGGFAKVWKVFNEQAQVTQAIKIYHHSSPETALLFQKVFARFFPLNHVNILRLVDYGQVDGCSYIVMPFCQNGSVEQYRGQYTHDQAMLLLQQAAKGLEYLHTKGIVHRDIKPDNLLIGDDNNYLLADFDISDALGVNLEGEPLLLGNTPPAYRAPEMATTADYDIDWRKADIFSLAATIFELVTGSPPYGMNGAGALEHSVTLPSLPEGYEALNQLIERCLLADSSRRPSATELSIQADRYFTANTPQENQEDVFEATVIDSGFSSEPETKPARKNRLALMLGLLVMLGAAAAYAFLPSVPDSVSPIFTTNLDLAPTLSETEEKALLKDLNAVGDPSEDPIKRYKLIDGVLKKYFSGGAKIELYRGELQTPVKIYSPAKDYLMVSFKREKVVDVRVRGAEKDGNDKIKTLEIYEY